MTERTFRMILGGLLLLFLYFEWQVAVYIYIGFLLFEGITNQRIPTLISRFRQGAASQTFAAVVNEPYRFGFEAERTLRLVIALFLVVSYIIFHEALWFFPWFIGFALTMAGITGICPMAILMRKVGFRG